MRSVQELLGECLRLVGPLPPPEVVLAVVREGVDGVGAGDVLDGLLLDDPA
jgi:hypothetical protein